MCQACHAQLCVSSCVVTFLVGKLCVKVCGHVEHAKLCVQVVCEVLSFKLHMSVMCVCTCVICLPLHVMQLGVFVQSCRVKLCV